MYFFYSRFELLDMSSKTIRVVGRGLGWRKKNWDWVGIMCFLSQLIPTGDVPNFCPAEIICWDSWGLGLSQYPFIRYLQDSWEAEILREWVNLSKREGKDEIFQGLAGLLQGISQRRILREIPRSSPAISRKTSSLLTLLIRFTFYLK